MSEAPIIRDYRPGDCEALATLYRRSVREIASKDYTPAEILAWAPDTLDMGKLAQRLASLPTFIAEMDGAIAGFTTTEPDGHIDLFYVHPDFQRLGVAGALLDFVIARGRAAGLPRLYAEVSRTARPVFERRGFKVLGAQRMEVRGQMLENFRMERPL